jgi:taurine dioxygenase
MMFGLATHGGAPLSEIRVRPVSNAVGAEVCGADLNHLSPGDFDVIRRAFVDHGVIFVHGQDLAPEQHIEFAERWGKINVNRFFAAVDGYPQIAEVRKEPDQTVNIGGGWHTDHSYDVEPAMGSILYARTVPDTGGDTLFASMYAAYDALSDGLKKTLENLEAVHSSRHVFGATSYQEQTGGRIGNPEAATQDAIHPLVITHPESGRKALYVNPGFTIGIHGWTLAESKPMLDFLFEHAKRPEFTFRFQWKRGSLAFWDNRATWHYALNDYHGQSRHMHRITVEGGPLR